MTVSPRQPTGRLVLDAPTLQRLSLELIDTAEHDPKRVDARLAAAEAHLRLVVAGAAAEKSRKLLERARTLDPYRPEVYFALGLELHRAGALESALELYDHALLLAPGDSRARYHRAVVLLDLARQEHSPETADNAREDFEAVLAAQPGFSPAAIGALEAAVHGKVKPLREGLKKMLARVPVRPEYRAAMTRLFYQVIFSFGVGAAKNVDASNKKSMAELVEAARQWLGAFPGDPGLAGVLAAATAKCDTPEQIVERVADYARDISDVRILRLLLRERLAEVSDPARRLELFEQAMKRIPPLDGVAQDFLQLQHLVAKRRIAEGEVSAARAAWQRCLELDPDNPGTVQNLLRLATHQGDDAEAQSLRARLWDLWTLYARFSPRADVILTRAAAGVETAVVADFTAVDEKLRENKNPTAAVMTDFLFRWMRAHALSRLAVDESARAATPGAVVRELVSLDRPAADVFDSALRVLALPLPADAPVAYAYYALAKDVPDEVLAKSKAEWPENMRRMAADAKSRNIDTAPYFALIERAQAEGRPLFDPVSRAAYDQVTFSTELAEFCRRHLFRFADLVEVSSLVDDDDVHARWKLADLLNRVPRTILDPYLPTTIKDPGWVGSRLLHVRFGGIVKKAWELLRTNQVPQALALVRPYLDSAQHFGSLQVLYASLVLKDPGRDLWSAVETAQRCARTAVNCLHWSDPPADREDAKRMAEDSPESIAQTEAGFRAEQYLNQRRTGAALEILWSVYPGMRGKPMPSATPRALAWARAQPTGRGFYAYVVAKSIRSNVIEWYNTLYNSQAYYAGTAREAMGSVERWIQHAKTALPTDRLPPQFIQQLQGELDQLLQALARDKGALGYNRGF